MSRPRLYMQEVASRDGFQNEPVFIATADKISFVDALAECGFAKIEVTSFTSPAAIPALRDAEEVMRGIRRRPGLEYTVLVPNVRGAQRALGCGVDEINIVMSVSETHNLANLRMSRARSIEQLENVSALVFEQGTALNLSLSTVFGCPMEGEVSEREVFDLIGHFGSLGVRRFTLCDTTGMAFPSQVRRICREARASYPDFVFTLHFHNTRGLAQANVLAAIDAGIDRFDASVGGIGGCPYAPGATGNACTEDLVHMLELEGFDTGIDLPRLVGVAARLPGLLGHEVPGQILKAGPRDRRHPAAVQAGDGHA